MAFAVSSVLIGVIYTFHFGLLGTGRKAEEKVYLNQLVATAFEKWTRELHMCERVLELHPDWMKFQKFHLDPEAGDELGMPVDSTRLETITYRLVRGDKSAHIERQVGFDEPMIFVRQVEDISDDIFKGYVLTLPESGSLQGPPRFHLFDPVAQAAREKDRICLLSIRLALTNGKDGLEAVSKVALPVVHARLIQPEFNLE